VSGGDLAAVLTAFVVVVVVLVLTVATWSLLRTMRELRATVDELRESTMPMVRDLRTTVAQANTDLARVEGIIDRAETITATVDSASRLTYRAVAPPIIRTMSIMAGARRAGRRLRGRAPVGAIEITDHAGRSHRALPRRRRREPGRTALPGTEHDRPGDDR
jgi:hypothetical protein